MSRRPSDESLNPLHFTAAVAAGVLVGMWAESWLLYALVTAGLLAGPLLANAFRSPPRD